MKALVTGGAGFIGSHLVETLLANKVKLKVMDNLSTGYMENFCAACCGFPAKMIPTVIFNDIPIDEDCIIKAVQDIDVVYHLAAIPSVPKSIEDPCLSYQSGVDLTFRMLYYAQRAGVKRFIYASSSSVYGGKVGYSQKEDQPLIPLSPYAATKAAGEQFCRSFSSCYDMDTVSLRFFNVYGPRQNPDSPYSGVISKFCKAFLDNTEIEIYGDGNQSRDFTFVKDLCDGITAVGRHKKAFMGIPINMGAGNSNSILDVLDVLEKITGTKKEKNFFPRRKGDVKKSMANTKLSKGLIGYNPKTVLEEGLRTTLDWHRLQSSHGQQ